MNPREIFMYFSLVQTAIFSHECLQSLELICGPKKNKVGEKPPP